MNQFTRRVLFFLFFLSGFSSLVYQMVWTRLAFASFGIIPPVLSVVLSVFMLGLALGSWAGGRWISGLTRKTGISAVFMYAGTELVIGVGAFAVPRLFAAGEKMLLASGETDSFAYLSLSALVLAVALLPWCVCMGMTFPFMLAYMRERERAQTAGFSFLYLANVLGAMSGTFLTALVWIEQLGFHHTLWLAAAGNFAVAFISVCLGLEQRKLAGGSGEVIAETKNISAPPPPGGQDGAIKWILFATGFVAMAMEVVWTRAFTPVLKTQVYSFAMVVFVYLGATFLGSWRYRWTLGRRRNLPLERVIPALAFAAFLPGIINTPKLLGALNYGPQIFAGSALLLLASITPFCAILGYLTPGLIDEYAAGNPTRAGRAYAINVLGCILGPLVACYFLLPAISERYALILLALPFLAFCFHLRRRRSKAGNAAIATGLGLTLAWAAFGTRDFDATVKEISGGKAIVRRDYTATVTSLGKGFHRLLLVNGIGMTILTPITKFMVHLPLALHQEKPSSALVICFGMGTSYRSAMSWGLDTTVVELVPSVTKSFGYFHDDAESLVNATNGHIVIDDGRRFLNRTAAKYDVIVVDPAPPVQAAGSSLLFSKDFYALARQHLQPGGILQMWFPGDDDPGTTAAALRSIHESFPYVRCFPSVQGWGMHMLGSMEPVPQFDAATLAARMPESARRDLLEWMPGMNASNYLERVLMHEYDIAACLDPNPAIEITDDKPYNEYYLCRHWFGPARK